MNFTWARAAMAEKQGVRRKGWRDEYWEYIDGNRLFRASLSGHGPEGAEPHVDFSDEDKNADDWEILPRAEIQAANAEYTARIKAYRRR